MCMLFIKVITHSWRIEKPSYSSLFLLILYLSMTILSPSIKCVLKSVVEGIIQ